MDIDKSSTEKTAGQQDLSRFGAMKSKAALISILSNSVLVAMKLAVGIFTGSVAVISEAVHSGMDLVAALMAFVSVKVADKPADKEHPYGHGKAENIAALFEGVLIIVAAVLIVHQAVMNLFGPDSMPSLGWGIMVMMFSTIVNIFVSRHLFAVGNKTESAALIADAWHLKTDVYTSFGVFLALGGIMLGEKLLPGTNLNFLDPVCAILVALMILKAGIKLSWEAVSNLLDQSLSIEEISLIKEHITQYAPQIKGYGTIQTRRSGSSRVVYMELFVDKGMSVEQAHTLGEEVSQSIKEHFPDSQISFHLEPK